MARRFIMRIELTGPSKQKLSTLSDRHGMTQVAMMSRLVEFFASQSELLQSAMIGRYPGEIEADIAKLILKRLADSK
ncbi:MAG TPA: hypothetical protein VHD56_13740 [Tepidisphaeraceae bacterium]|nr:hypothetical protein [Tepidisphaeraceae bacterium]